MDPLAALVLGSSKEVIPVIVLGGGVIIAIVAILSSAITTISSHRQSERTRREIAAYVAEGSMTPDEGARLIAAFPGKRSGTRAAASPPSIPTPPSIPDVPTPPRAPCCMKHA